MWVQAGAYRHTGDTFKNDSAEQEAVERVELMFEMYAKPDTSLGDITRHFAERGIDFGGKELQRKTLSIQPVEKSCLRTGGFGTV